MEEVHSPEMKSLQRAGRTLLVKRLMSTLKKAAAWLRASRVCGRASLVTGDGLPATPVISCHRQFGSELRCDPASGDHRMKGAALRDHSGLGDHQRAEEQWPGGREKARA